MFMIEYTMHVHFLKWHVTLSHSSPAIPMNLCSYILKAWCLQYMIYSTCMNGQSSWSMSCTKTSNLCATHWLIQYIHVVSKKSIVNCHDSWSFVFALHSMDDVSTYLCCVTCRITCSFLHEKTHLWFLHRISAAVKGVRCMFWYVW